VQKRGKIVPRRKRRRSGVPKKLDHNFCKKSIARLELRIPLFSSDPLSSLT